MKLSKLLLLVTVLAVPGLSGAAVATIPGASSWYFHADFHEMRSTAAGRHLYAWLEREVFEEIREDAGIDLSKEADALTAFAGDDTGAVMLLEGKVSQDSKDKLLAMATARTAMATHTYKGKTFYFVEGDADHDIKIDSFDNGMYFSFALQDRIVATSALEKMQELLDRDGRIERQKTANGTLVVLTAEKSLIQAGMKADGIDDNENEGSWKSNILRNTEQVAVLVADMAGKLAVETRLVAKQPELAESLASIVRGLISLTMFSNDMDPDVSALLQGTTVDVDGSQLNIRLSLDPEKFVAVLED